MFWRAIIILCLTFQWGRADEPIDTSGFWSSIDHWRHLKNDDRFIQAIPDQPSYAPAQVPEIVANILLYQRENGGWPKDYDMLAILTDEQKVRVRATHRNMDTSYDNGNLHSQVVYLAKAYTRSEIPEWRAACERGLDFILSSQYPNGGFPQRFPKPKSYHAHITFNDGVMIGIMKVLNSVARNEPHFAWLDDDRRQRSHQAVERGIDCMLRCQIEIDGIRTGWCQQHDEKTFAPCSARSFELASLCPQETSDIIRFLEQQTVRTVEMTRAIESAKAWLTKARLHGIRIDKVRANKESFLRHEADFDIIVVADPVAKPIWARHYEIETGRPIFAGRDGVKKYSLAEIDRERRTGTLWYGYWPAQILD